ncbi:MAG: right-handed parallel beta-helix repeat-containing protein [Myxococcales bacterium]|nr:right-handed parallel beta-helix repeat-containing protein [Myxococcales bacterium]MCB9641849.1 right-handed parallel beta-helix repeat-containing protein [Myxococcales bacterium]
MTQRRMFVACLCACLLLCVGGSWLGCAPPVPENEIRVTIVEGSDPYAAIQEALIKAKSGKIVVLPEGKFSLDRSLSLTVDGVTVRGQGMDKTVLSFKNQKVEDNKKEGAQGLRVQASGVVLEDFAIEDTQGDAIKVEDADGITFRKIRVEWTKGPDKSNGSYGLYPVKSKRVLIEDCVAIAASDAGIYVGQSEEIIVRRNRAENNVAGIEIENSKNADVYDNIATKNTGGILVFDLPKLPTNGKGTRVFKNMVFGNNTANFAPEGAIVGNVPKGVGVMVLSTDSVEIFENDIKDNQTANVLIVNYEFAVGKYEDTTFDPYPEGIYIHDNKFANGGYDPSGKDFELLVALIGKPLPDVIYDGIFDEKKQVDGKTPAELMLCFKNNGTGTFVNLHAYKTIPEPNKDPKPHECELPALKSIDFDKNP